MLIACDGVTFSGKDHDRLAVVAELCAALPSLHHVVLQDNLGMLDAARKDPENAIHTIANKAYFTTATAKNSLKNDYLSCFVASHGDFPLKRHHMVHFSTYTYPFTKVVVVVAGDVG